MWTRFQWQRKRRSGIAFLLLPALLYRAAIPAGFMPMVDDDGHIGLMFCPGQVVARPGNDVHAAHHHHSNHHGVPGNTEPAGQHVPCPFALSAGPAPLPTMLAATSSAPSPGHVPAQITAQTFPLAIVRAQAARGPPASPNY